MARVTVSDCLERIPNRFELVIIAAKRARQLEMEGAESMVAWENDKPTVVALREIAEGFIGSGALEEGSSTKPLSEASEDPASGDSGEAT